MFTFGVLRHCPVSTNTADCTCDAWIVEIAGFFFSLFPFILRYTSTFGFCFLLWSFWFTYCCHSVHCQRHVAVKGYSWVPSPLQTQGYWWVWWIQPNHKKCCPVVFAPAKKDSFKGRINKQALKLVQCIVLKNCTHSFCSQVSAVA